ncbi:MAG: alpha/beta hydrolase [Pseudomonadales bacterium]|nr:alpha/beta hydrolase [Pseudomonadales bacterium]
MPIKNDILVSASSYASSYFKGIKAKRCTLNNEDYSYLEGGSGDTIIFLHGMGISKAFWRGSLSQLQKQYHVIALDVPGMNIYKQLKSKRTTFDRLSKWLNDFINYKGISKVHLISQSVSGGICAYYASNHPETVQSLGLLSLPQWFESPDYPKPLIFSLINELESADSDAMDLYVKSNFHKAPKVSEQMKKAHVWLFNKHLGKIKTTLHDLELSFKQLPVRLGRVKCPVLLLYGEHDQFIGKNMKPMLKDWFPNTSINTIPDCGHIPSMEKPTVFYQEYTYFLDHLPTTNIQRSPIKSTGTH